MPGLHHHHYYAALLIGVITVAVFDKEKVFLMDNGKCIYFSLSVQQKKWRCVGQRKSFFLMDNGKCIYFSLSVLQKKFSLTRPLWCAAF